ncbi:MAG: HlyD family type I secretion periplasmic adaptor subunit [Campylobacterales bacterium]|nr:HlyD family type I secretion periplasmic adaptor subunit [Campylobacterales bacterium]
MASNFEEDMNFVNTMYANANEKPGKRSFFVFLLISSFFVFAIIWASLAEIDELARGNGKVIPTDKIQKIQSLDGGIISEILVKEGQVVKKHDQLMKIDTTRFQASWEENKSEYLNLLAIKTRLIAESNINLSKKIPKLKFNKVILEEENKNYVFIENRLFQSRFNELKYTIRVLDNQYEQKKLEVKEITSTIKKLRRSLKIIRKQKATIQKLVNSRIKSKYDLLNIQKEYEQARGDLETSLLSKPRARLAVLESKNRKEEKIRNFKAEASNSLNKTENELRKYKSRLVADKDKLNKTILLSPVDGIVKQININTIGGVVRSGMDLIEIVPQSESLLIEAKIDPKDIAFINPKQKAIIKITAYDFSIYGGLEGKIIEISADSIVDKDSKDQKSYYRILVKTDKNYLERNGIKHPIIPGMIASIDIVTGKKSILDFILKPILKTKNNALHER